MCLPSNLPGGSYRYLIKEKCKDETNNCSK